MVEPEMHKWKWKAILGIAYVNTNYFASSRTTIYIIRTHGIHIYYNGIYIYTFHIYV